VSATLHLTDPPEGFTDWEWTRATQVAAALIAGRIDQGWDGSLRRDALLSMLRGPTDWITEAALAALVCVYREPDAGPETRADIEAALRELAGRLPNQGHCCFHHALAWAVHAISAVRNEALPGFDALWEYLKEP